MTTPPLPLRRLTPYPAMNSTFGPLRTWLAECDSSHSLCRRGHASFIPSRLIQLNVRKGKAYPRLVDTVKGVPYVWCALSYVWGGDQKLKTTAKTLQAYQESLPWSELPATFRDAVQVTHGFEILYLWIDVFCIIQDDQADLARELRSLPQIFQDAYLTIEASCARSVNEGFLDYRGFFYQRFPPIRLCIQEESTGLRGEVIMVDTDSPAGNMLMFKNPIDTRAWTYQESLLTSRLLQYTNFGLIWRCKTCGFFQDSVSEKPEDDDADNMTSPIHEAAHGNLPSKEGRLVRWAEIVEEFASRRVTSSSDKVMALSAIARVYADANHDSYLAGLWRQNLIFQLLWKHEGGPEVVRRPQKYRAPSWSWLAVDGRLFKTGVSEHEWSADGAEVLDVQVVPKPGFTAFDAIQSGSITVRGKMKLVRWHHRQWPPNISGIGQHKLQSFRDADEEGWCDGEDACQEVWALLLCKKQELEADDEYSCHRGGLLLQETGSGRFSRVGAFECHSFTDNTPRNCDESFANLETRTIVVV